MSHLRICSRCRDVLTGNGEVTTEGSMYIPEPEVCCGCGKKVMDLFVLRPMYVMAAVDLLTKKGKDNGKG